MSTHKHFERETYHMKSLPVELAESVLTKTREFIEFLQQSGASTHPDVRIVLNAAEGSLAGLVGQVEAGKVKQRVAAGEFVPDEMDNWGNK